MKQGLRLPSRKAKGLGLAVSNTRERAALQLASWSQASDGGVVRRIYYMLRWALYVSGVSAGLAAWVIFGDKNRVARRQGRVPVKQAAAMLQEAWADHHTQA